MQAPEGGEHLRVARLARIQDKPRQDKPRQDNLHRSKSFLDGMTSMMGGSNKETKRRGEADGSTKSTFSMASRFFENLVRRSQKEFNPKNINETKMSEKTFQEEISTTKMMEIFHENSRLENVIEALRQKNERRKKAQSEKTHGRKSVNGSNRISDGFLRYSEEEYFNDFREECLGINLWNAKMREEHRFNAMRKGNRSATEFEKLRKAELKKEVAAELINFQQIVEGAIIFDEEFRSSDFHLKKEKELVNRIEKGKEKKKKEELNGSIEIKNDDFIPNDNLQYCEKSDNEIRLEIRNVVKKQNENKEKIEKEDKKSGDWSDIVKENQRKLQVENERKLIAELCKLNGVMLHRENMRKLEEENSQRELDASVRKIADLKLKIHKEEKEKEKPLKESVIKNNEESEYGINEDDEREDFELKLILELQKLEKLNETRMKRSVSGEKARHSWTALNERKEELQKELLLENQLSVESKFSTI